MKALVLSGGNGTRLRPLTWSQAKQLVPVANKPVLYYVLEQIADTGIRDTGVVVGHTFPAIRQAVADGSRWGLNVTYIHQEAPLGLAHAVQVAGEFLGDSPFLMALGDNLLFEDLRPIVQQFERSGEAAHVLLSEVPNPEMFGVAHIEDGKLVGLIEKPKRPPSKLALVGIYLFRPDIHEAVRSIRPSTRGELEITDAIQYLIRSGKEVGYTVVSGWWKDTGTIESLLDANRLVLQMTVRGRSVQSELPYSVVMFGPVRIGKSCHIERSVIRGPVVIGDGCHIEGCTIGPSVSIGNDCRLKQVDISNSVVMNGTCISLNRHHLSLSVIGSNVSIKESEHLELVLGDNSTAILPKGW